MDHGRTHRAEQQNVNIINILLIFERFPIHILENMLLYNLETKYLVTNIKNMLSKICT